MLPTPLADEYTRGIWSIDPVVRPSCGLLALPHVGLDVLLIKNVPWVSHSSPTVQFVKDSFISHIIIPTYNSIIPPQPNLNPLLANLSYGGIMLAPRRK